MTSSKSDAQPKHISVASVLVAKESIMSDTSIDYKDSRIDPGGDKNYDSSAYGTTDGNLKAKPDQGVFGSEDAPATGASKDRPKERQVEQGIQTQPEHSQQPTGESRTQDESEAKKVQGYTATGDMNPEVGA
jgi:hypothetical protein